MFAVAGDAASAGRCSLPAQGEWEKRWGKEKERKKQSNKNALLVFPEVLKKKKIKWDEVHEDSGDLSQDTHLGESYPGLHLLDSWISRAFTLLLSDSRLSH